MSDSQQYPSILNPDHDEVDTLVHTADDWVKGAWSYSVHSMLAYTHAVSEHLIISYYINKNIYYLLDQSKV